MPKPAPLDEKDFTVAQLANMPILTGKPLTDKHIQLEEDIVALGREVVKLVKDGKIELFLSKVIDDTLFVCSSIGYYVLPPEGGIRQSDTAELGVNGWPYEGPIDNLRDLMSALTSWRDEALSE